MQNTLMHAGNSLTQYKCRQKFNLNKRVSTYHNATVVCKFAEKYRFKGPYDGLLKLIKSTINKLEHKCMRAVNTSE